MKMDYKNKIYFNNMTELIHENGRLLTMVYRMNTPQEFNNSKLTELKTHRHVFLENTPRCKMVNFVRRRPPFKLKLGFDDKRARKSQPITIRTPHNIHLSIYQHIDSKKKQLTDR